MKVLLAGLLALGMLAGCGGGGTTPLQACKDQGAQECKKMWSCNSPVKIGNDEASCITSYDSLCQLAAAGCPTGKTQDLSKVPACISDTANATCAEYNAGSYRAANCDAVKCK